MSGIGGAKVGDRLAFATRFFDEDGEVTTGTATTRVWRNNAGTIEYLQSDASSWSTTAHDFADNAFAAGLGFLKEVTIPSSADGHILTLQKTHSDADLVPYTETWRVTTKDLDDVFEEPGASLAAR